MTDPKLVCPGCNYEFVPDLLIEIYGYCCLNERCEIGVTKPNKFWYSNEVYHREDGPAIEYSDGTNLWYLNGQLHRQDGPAVEYVHQKFLTREWYLREWYLNGKKHRIGEPAVEFADGAEEWFLNGKRHREDGPAIIYSDSKEWWVNGKRHREDGPAIEYKDGGGEWWINDELEKAEMTGGKWKR